MANPLSARLSLAMLAVGTLAALGAPWLSPFNPNEQVATGGRALPPLTRGTIVTHVDRGLFLGDVHHLGTEIEIVQPYQTHRFRTTDLLDFDAGQPPRQRLYILGSDILGRDVLSRLLHGARISYFIALVSILVTMTLGIAVGTLAALGGPFVDTVLMRLVDGLLALPWLIVLIALARFYPGSALTLALIIGASSWMTVSRLARAELQRLAREDFVLAARALGASPWRIFHRHLLPHAATPLMVRATLGMAGVIVAEASLSYLGFGVSVPTASWGSMIADGKSDIFDHWWIATFPALALIASVMALSLVSDGLRDALDPRRRPTSDTSA